MTRKGSTTADILSSGGVEIDSIKCVANDSTLFLVCVSGGSGSGFSRVYSWNYRDTNNFELLQRYHFRVTDVLGSSSKLVLICKDTNEMILLNATYPTLSHKEKRSLITCKSSCDRLYLSSKRVLSVMEISKEKVDQERECLTNIVYINVLKYEGGRFVLTADIDGELTKWSVKLQPIASCNKKIREKISDCVSSKTNLVVAHGCKFTVLTLGMERRSEHIEKERITSVAMCKEYLLVQMDRGIAIWRGCVERVGVVPVIGVRGMVGIAGVGLVCVGPLYGGDCSVALWRDYNSVLQGLVSEAREGK
eukprot:sb/3467194/